MHLAVTPFLSGAEVGKLRLEEVAGVAARDMAAAYQFARSVLPADGRPAVFAATRAWLGEVGRPFGWAFDREKTRLVLVAAQREAEVLWATEEALKSGAVASVIAAVGRPSLLATRRLDNAARKGGAGVVILRAGPADDLSAAWRRWQISALASAAHPWDAKAPGAPRLRAELVRSRDSAPGAWILEWDHAADRFRLVEGLADHGLGEDARTIAAA